MTEPDPNTPKGNNMSPFGDGQVKLSKYAGFSVRLAQSAETAGFNSARLAAQLQISRSTMARYWNGERLAPADVLFRIAELVRANPLWLVTGEGDPEPIVGEDPDLSSEENALLDAFRRLPAEQRRHVLQNTQMLADPHTLHAPRTTFRGDQGV